MPGKLGEREIIRMLTGIYRTGRRFPLGFDDDVAAIPLSPRKWIIVKNDMLIGSTDMPPRMTLGQAARKAVVATVSDFAAKGVKPSALMVSLGLPARFGRAQIRDIGAGLARGAREYDCSIIGGDTNQCDDFVIDCVGVGWADPREVITRSGAEPGDIVAVTGKFGNAAAGLRMLLSGRAGSLHEEALAEAVLFPKARLAEGLALSGTGVVTGAIDSSDGLAWSLYEIARASKVSIHLDKVPTAPEADSFSQRAKLDPVELTLYGGEEYELVVTVKDRDFAKVKRRVSSLIPIGRVDRGPAAVTAELRGRTVKVEARGWEHFRRQS